MARILFILLSLAGLVTAFQNCGIGGSLNMDKSLLGASNALSKLLGSCSGQPNGKTCEETWGKTSGDVAAVAASCATANGQYANTPCPATPDLLGVCEVSSPTEIKRMHFYAGYSNGAIAAGQEANSAKQACQGTWQ